MSESFTLPSPIPHHPTPITHSSAFATFAACQSSPEGCVCPAIEYEAIAEEFCSKPQQGHYVDIYLTCNDRQLPSFHRIRHQSSPFPAAAFVSVSEVVSEGACNSCCHGSSTVCFPRNNRNIIKLLTVIIRCP